MATHASNIPHTAEDRAWYADQVEALLPELYGTARRLTGNEVEAEDLVAETVAKGWAALASLDDRSAARAWLFRIQNNLWISRWRSARGQAVHEPLDTAGDEPFSLFDRLHRPLLLWGGNPELEFLNRLLREDLARAIDALTDPFRTVVVLVDVQGLSYRDAADLLGVPVGTVRSRLARGRSQLQEQLWQHAVEAGLRPSAETETGDRHGK
jgi:RNA polymerase sigma-70 factor, ECF subfamily